MRKMNVLLLVSTLILGGGAFAGGLVVALRHEPNFYRHCAAPAGLERKKLSELFFKEAAQLWADVNARDGGKWRHAFSEAQINSFFEEDFVRLGEADNLHRHGVSGPRVMLDDNRLRLAFRYGSGVWSTI